MENLEVNEENIRKYLENDPELQISYRLSAEIGYIFLKLLEKGIISEEDLKDHDEYVNKTVKRTIDDAVQYILNNKEEDNEEIWES